MKKLIHSDVYAECVPSSISGASTKSLEPLEEIVGQERAQEAVRFAMAMPGSGYNIYAIGRTGLGKRTMMLRYLKRQITPKHDVSDWCYVVNFEEPRNPTMLQLPVGQGIQLKRDMEALMTRLTKAIP
ncbi:Lon-like protease helical domain-containing protein, partial [Oleiphilus sp. HI0080]